MKLILARHGNTFGKGDTPVWVGAKEDYPLVERGLEQAREVGEALLRNTIKPDRIIAGPLLRTKVGAEIVSDMVGFAGQIEIDDRLREIDYGSWGGKSDAEIEALHGADVIENWRENSVRPDGCDWSPDEDTLQAHALEVLTELKATADQDMTVLLISSNGILRFYHALLYAGQSDAPSGKVKTGHMCLAEWKGETFAPKSWNLPPDQFTI